MEPEAGCDPGVTVDSGNPLLRAVYLRRLRLTRLLLEGGAYINESDRRGRTPLMVACGTRHVDAQSASRVQLVRFLLEKGADPNIQDKDGGSALMHACRGRTSPEVVSLLLAHGADVSLEDQSGTSALVYAVMAGDWTVLKLLLDTCKAQGKEVIIITTDTFPGGTQHLCTPSLGPLGQTDTSTAAPASPSEIQLIASPQATSSSSHCPKPVFFFKGGQSCGVSSHPGSPSRFQRLAQNEAPHGLLRLNSEPWLKVPESLVARQPPAASSSSEHGRDVSQTEDLLRIPKLVGNNNTKSPTGSFRCYERGSTRYQGGEGTRRNGRAKQQNTSLPGLLLSHSASQPNLHSENPVKDSVTSSYSFSGGKGLCNPLQSLASSSLYRILQRHKLGADVYSSDPLLATDVHNVPVESQHRAGDLTDGRRLVPLGYSSTPGPRETTSGQHKRAPLGFERRGSGSVSLEQLRPRSLPPLTLGSTSAPSGESGFSEKELGQKNVLPSAPPGGRPEEPPGRMLLRRHSVQSEQVKTTA